MYNHKIVKLEPDKYISNEFIAGEGCKTRVIASIGTTLPQDSHKTELKKALIAVSAGADVITDHSVQGDIKSFHKILRKHIDIPLSSIPVYELSSNYLYRNKPSCDTQEVLELIEGQLSRGINLLTLHATVLEQDVYNPISSNRIIPITSKGGLMMIEHMKRTKSENPFYSNFDDILDICKRYNSIISLGPTYRPASVCDNAMNETDPHWIEIQRMSELVNKAIKKEVPIMIEGIGHAKLSDIPKLVANSKQICFGIPYRVLTVATDIALGYDVISSAIASATAVLHGADIITSVTSAEHVGLPSVEQIEEAVVAARIAAHSADICVLGDTTQDLRMSVARSEVGSCHGMVEKAIYPPGAEKALRNKKFLFEGGCDMCGDFCALKNRNQ